MCVCVCVCVCVETMDLCIEEVVAKKDLDQ